MKKPTTKKKKLSLNKLQIAKINNLNSIKGGGDYDGRTDEDPKTVPTVTK